MNVDPRQLKLLLAIIEHGTFNRAAEALHMSQPALSKNISLLEHSLGAKLFDRGKRGTTPTMAGLIAARAAQNVSWAIKNAEEEIKAQSEGVSGPLFIGAIPSMMQGLLPRALTELTVMYPNVSINVYENLDDILHPALERGEIELLIGVIDAPNQNSTNIKEIFLAKEQFHVGLPLGHPLSDRQRLSLKELIKDPWVLPSKGSSFYRIVEAMFLAAGYDMPRNSISTNSLRMQETLASQANRIILLTPSQFYGRTVPFKVAPLVESPFRSIGIRYRSEFKLSPIAAPLIESLKLAAQTLESSLVS